MGLGDAPLVGDDAGFRKLIERLDKLETQLALASASLGGVNGLIEQQNLMATQIDYLTARDKIAGVGGTSTHTCEDATSLTWLPFDASIDASIDVDPNGVTLPYRIEAWAYPRINSGTADARICIEIIAGSEVIKSTSSPAQYGSLNGVGPLGVTLGTGPGWLFLPYPPHPVAGVHTIRVRRGYSSATAGSVTFDGSILAVTQIYPG